MLIHPTIEKLERMRLTGMATALREQLEMDGLEQMGFEERLGLLIDREASVRETRRMRSRLKKARLRQNACIEDIDFSPSRGMDKGLIMKLSDCQWIAKHHNLIIIGPTGVGKSYLACAFGQKACRDGYTTVYHRTARLFEELALAKGDGRYVKLLKTISKADLLILDDYGLSTLTKEQCQDLLEVLEDRYGLRSTLVTSQLPLKHWHEQMEDPTLADAILDRLVHNAYKIELKGGSMRKKKANLTFNKEND